MLNYTKPELNDTYLSQWEHIIGGGMAGPYYLTDLFLNSTLQDPIFPPELIAEFDPEDPEAFYESLSDNWQDVLKTNSRILTAISFGLVMALILPILGRPTYILQSSS